MDSVHLNNLARTVTDNLDKFELGHLQKVQDFIWEVYCDWYIEIAKVGLNSTDPEEADNARKVLVYVLTPGAEAAASLHALHHRGDLPCSARHFRDHHDRAVARILRGAELRC